MEVQDHVTGIISDGGVWVGRRIIEEDLRDGMYRAVKRGVYEMWLGRVSGVVAKEIVATDVAASAGL